MKNSKLQFVFLCPLLITFSQVLSAQLLPEKDCTGAIQELAILDTFPAYESDGQFQELQYPFNTSCLVSGEEGSVWIRFSVCENDTLEFLIIPVSPGEDFDWALYDITNKTCQDAIDSMYELRCNYSAMPGPTGLEVPHEGTSSPSGGPNKLAALSCFAGQSLLLMVNNHANVNTGFVLSFTGNVVPCQLIGIPTEGGQEKIEVYPNPASDFLTINFSSSNFSTAQIKITDVLGRNLFSDEIKNNQPLQISTDKFSGSNVLLCQLWQDGKMIAVKKVLIEK